MLNKNVIDKLYLHMGLKMIVLIKSYMKMAAFVMHVNVNIEENNI